MSRTISQLTAGTPVWIYENISGTPEAVEYIYCGLDEYGKARLLRWFAAVQKRMNATNVASYNGCVADLWLEDTENGFLSRFDADTLNALENTTITYTDYNQSADGTEQVLSIARRCFLSSYYEMLLSGNEGGMNVLAALQTYTGSTGRSARIARTSDGNSVYAWLRSADGSSRFWTVISNGATNSNNASISDFWLRPALSVAAATSVSDEGADAIFLLPDTHRTYWPIDFTASIGQTERRPKQGKIFIPHTVVGPVSVQVCNNYADANPTWLDTTSEGVVTFGADKTADNWEVGVKIHADASTAGQMVYEPAMILEYEEA